MLYEIQMLPSFCPCLPPAAGKLQEGKRAYEQGDYYEAVLKSVHRLRQKPSHKKSRAVLAKSYPMTLQTFEKKAW